MKSIAKVTLFILTFISAAAQQLGVKKWESQNINASSFSIGPTGTIFAFGGASGKLYSLDGVTGGKKWERNLSGTPQNFGIGSDGDLYVTVYNSNSQSPTNSSVLQRIDPQTGGARWSYVGEGVSTIAIDDQDNLFFRCYWRESRSWAYVSLSGANGKPRWAKPIGYIFSRANTPVVGEQGDVIFNYGTNSIASLNRETGLTNWRFESGGDILSNLIIGPNGRIYFGGRDKRLNAINISTGAKIWEYKTDGEWNIPSAIGTNGMIYSINTIVVSSTNPPSSEIVAINPDNGTKKWKIESDRWSIFRGLALGKNNEMYVSQNDGVLRAVDIDTGKTKWIFTDNPKSEMLNPSIGPDGLIYSGSGGKIVAIESNSGGPAESSWSMPGSGPQSTSRVGVSGYPPRFTVQPRDLVIEEGQDATIAASAIGGSSVNYQWQRNAENILGANLSICIITNAAISQQGEYRVVASNPSGKTTSMAARLTVKPVAPSIVDQSKSTQIYAEQRLLLTVTAAGSAPLLYQWKKGEIAINGATNASFEISKVVLSDSGYYSVEIRNVGGSKSSERIQVQVNPLPPLILSQPRDIFVKEGGTAGLRIAIGGTAPFKYTWYFNDKIIPGMVTDTMLINSAKLIDRGVYKVTVGNSSGSVTSSPALIKVAENLPRITNQPSQQIVGSGKNLVLNVEAEGSTPLKYQWQFNGSNIIGANSSTFKLTNIQIRNQGVYAATVENSVGSVKSQSAFITVTNAAGSMIWELQTGETGSVRSVLSSPAISDNNTVYVGASDGNLYAIDGKYGYIKWKFKTGGEIESSPSIAIDDTVFVGSSDGRLYAFEGLSGKKKWETMTGGPIQSSPAIGLDGAVYVGSNDGYLYSVDGKTGALRWQFKAQDRIYSSPSIGSDGTIIVGSNDQKIYGIDSATGKKKWEFLTLGRVYTSAAIAYDGTAYIVSQGQNIYGVHAVESSTGYLKWISRENLNGFTLGSINSPAIGEDGSIYVGGKSLDRRTGAVKSFGDLNSGVANAYSTPALGADGTVYFGLGDSVIAVNFVTGKRIWKYTTAGLVFSSPALGVDGTIYVGSDDGKIYALASDSPGLANSSWPMDGGGPKHLRRAGTAGIAPSIATQPSDKVIIPADKLMVAAKVFGTLPISYQWQINGKNIPAAESSVLEIPNVQLTDQGEYQVIAANSWGSVTGKIANVRVKHPLGYKKWETLTRNPFQSVPAIAEDGSVICTSGDFRLFKVDRANGLQEQIMPNAEFRTSPTIGNDRVIYIVNKDWQYGLTAIDISNLKPIWQIPKLYSLNQSLGLDNSVYVSATGSIIIKYNGISGVKIWDSMVFLNSLFPFPANNSLFAQSIGVDGVIYSVGSSLKLGEGNFGRIIAIDESSGAKKWEIVEQGVTFTTASIGGDNTIFVGCSGDRSGVYAFNSKTGAKKWEFISGAIKAQPVIGLGGVIFAGSSDDKKVYAVDGTTGQVKWEFLAGGGINSTPTIGSNGVVYVGSDDQKIYAIDPYTGERIWDFKTGGPVRSSAAIDSDGSMYIGSDDGKLYSLVTDSLGLADSSWPKIYADNSNTSRSRSQAPLLGISYSSHSGITLSIPAFQAASSVLEYSTNFTVWKQQQRFSRTSASSPVIFPVTNNNTYPVMFWRLRVE